jgi:hypothetical protein
VDLGYVHCTIYIKAGLILQAYNVCVAIGAAFKASAAAVAAQKGNPFTAVSAEREGDRADYSPHTVTHVHIHTHAYMYTYIRTYMYVYIHTYRHTDIQTDRQTDRHIYIYTLL